MSPVRSPLNLLLILFLCTGFSWNGLSPSSVNGQRLDGLWEGTMLVGGLDGTTELPMQLYLTMSGRVARGRSYVHLPNGSILRMDLEGTYYHDGSMQLSEVAFAGDPANDLMPAFNRQYQVVLTDDIWNPIITGYWQEVTEEVFKKTRRLGRMRLKRRNPDGA